MKIRNFWLSLPFLFMSLSSSAPVPHESKSSNRESLQHLAYVKKVENKIAGAFNKQDEYLMDIRKKHNDLSKTIGERLDALEAKTPKAD